MAIGFNTKMTIVDDIQSPIEFAGGFYTTTIRDGKKVDVACVHFDQAPIWAVLSERSVRIDGAGSDQRVYRIGKPFFHQKLNADMVYLYLSTPEQIVQEKKPVGKIKPKKSADAVLRQRIVEELKLSGKKLNTTILLKRIGKETKDRPQVLVVLHEMADAGEINRTGKNPYRWSVDTPFQADAIGGNTGEAPKEESSSWAVIEPIAQNFGEDTGKLVEMIKILTGKVQDLQTSLVDLSVRTNNLEAGTAAANSTTTLVVKKYDGAKVELEDVCLPPQFGRVLQLASQRKNVLLTGPAGCGKSFLAKLIADSLDTVFGGVNCCEDMSKSEIVGRNVPNLHTGKDVFQSTKFLDIFANGGVFLFDEIDGCDANVLLAINTALANRYIETLGGRIDASPDFICIATANTYGTGSNKSYSGRRPLDEATLDRFRIGMIECGYDRELEKKLCPNIFFLKVFWDIRKAITDLALRRVLSTRFIEDAYLMKSACGWTVQDTLTGFFSPWTKGELDKLKGNLTFETKKELPAIFAG